MTVAVPSTAIAERADAIAPARRGPRGGIAGRQGVAGWLFVTPVVVILGLFLLLPILMALFVSFTKWNGQGSPFTSGCRSPAAPTTPTSSPSTA